MEHLPTSAHNTLTTPEKEYRIQAIKLLQEVKSKQESTQVSIRVNKKTLVTVGKSRYSKKKEDSILKLFSNL